LIVFERGYFMKKIISGVLIFILILIFPVSCSRQNTKTSEEYIEKAENSTVLLIKDNAKSVKRKSSIFIDGEEIGYKSEKINKEFKRKEYTVSAKDGTVIFYVKPMTHDVVSDKTFSIYGVVDRNNKPLAYIQSGVFRGKECYILYSSDTSRYAFCETEKADKGTFKPEYNIISFEDELLYKLTVSADGEGNFSISSEKKRPESKNEIVSLATAILISDDEYNSYANIKTLENKNKAE